MTGSSLGKRFVVTSYGESHGPKIGMVIDGCPAGLELSVDEIQQELRRRQPSSERFSTQRREADQLEISSGVFKGRTTGAAISLSVSNLDTQSEAYEERRYTPRPGQADLVARLKYGGYEDYRGGGRFSARITVGFVAAGAVAKKLIGTIGMVVYAHTVEIAGIRARKVAPEEEKKASHENPLSCADPETAEKMIEAIAAAKSKGDSVGGVIEAVATGIPVGLGEPVFDNLDGDLSKAFFAIPSVKAVQVGAGFESARMRGSEYNDPLMVREGRIESPTNNSGGIIGGLSNGQRVVCRLAFRPPSSIAIPQRTVNLQTMREEPLLIKGRFDSCVVPRAIPIVEAMMAIVLADHALRGGLIPPVLRTT
ncbi:chorismate synthase [[Eubacterium] cellulosolvens]